MARLWFKRHRYGFGWTPATWQGWMVVTSAMGVVIAASLLLMQVTAPPGTWWPTGLFILVVLATIASLVGITLTKGPSPRWRWGRQPGDDPEEDF